jgi:hypothetical protein
LPSLSISACLLRLSIRSPCWDLDGTGALGGGPVAVIGRAVAFREVVDDNWRVEVVR